jgi:hypothetical protein
MPGQLEHVALYDWDIGGLIQFVWKVRLQGLQLDLDNNH